MKVVSRTKLAQAFVAFLEKYPLDQLSQAFAALLRQQGRVGELNYLLADIARQLLRQKKHLVVQLTSARPLPTSLLKEIQMFVQQRSGAVHVELAQRQDASLLGGIIARTSEFEVEWSLKKRLNRLRHV